MKLRAITRDDYDAVARLICESTNRWYAQRNMGPIFTAGPAACRIFTDVYETLDPGCCVIAADEASGQLMGSCFYHPRETHLSLGIMNVHPDFFSPGVARELLRFVCDVADREQKPLRLVSSAKMLTPAKPPDERSDTIRPSRATSEPRTTNRRAEGSRLPSEM